jgi:hypothetical protein
MPERIAKKLQHASMLALLTSASLGGCMSNTQSSLTFFADPAKYEFSSCQSLAGQQKHLAAAPSGTQTADGQSGATKR